MKINLSPTSTIKPLVPGPRTPEQELAAARELKQAYGDFIGKTFFGQMLKAMRSTVGKPAYFHGGQAEEMFRSQLDQHLADGMTAASAAQLADPMFEQQFPRQAALVRAADGQSRAALGDLAALRRY